MQSHSIVLIAVAIISILGNIIQFFLNKKSKEICDLKNEFELIKQMQKEKSEQMVIALQERDKTIEKLTEKVQRQESELKNLRQLFTKMLADGCHNFDCTGRQPYTVEEINKMTNNKKNEKNNK